MNSERTQNAQCETGHRKFISNSSAMSQWRGSWDHTWRSPALEEPSLSSCVTGMAVSMWDRWQELCSLKTLSDPGYDPCSASPSGHVCSYSPPHLLPSRPGYFLSSPPIWPLGKVFLFKH